MLSTHNTTFVLISRAPLAKLEAYKAQKGWSIPWFSSFGSEFNYGFHVTLDPKVAPAEYNYRNKAEMEAAKGHSVLLEGEEHGLSVFFRLDDEIFTATRRTRAAPNRSRMPIVSSTRRPMGWQQDFEESPAGWPQKPTYGKVESTG